MADSSSPACPNCSKAISAYAAHNHGVCIDCGLSAPLKVLDALAKRFEQGERDYAFQRDAKKAARLTSCKLADEVHALRHEIERLKSPAVVLAEAEQLLRYALVNRVGLGSTTGVHIATYMGERGYGYSLAEAYAALTATNAPESPDSSGGRDG